jgi:hypothetical protein
MASTVEIDTGIGETGVAAPRRTFPRALRTYTFLAAVIAGLLLGVGLRFVPATASATPGNAAQGAGATACAAK